MSEVTRGNPLLQVRRQNHGLARLVGDETWSASDSSQTQLAERIIFLPAANPPTTHPISTSTRGFLKEQADKPRFEFYTLLPEMEVVVETEAFKPRAGKRRESVEPPPLAGAHVLQAGSFRSYGEAHALKASLALLGLESVIQTVSIDGEQTWHRVRLGPFTRRDELEDARRQLADHQIDAVVFKSR